jgi:hypothetical protein
VESVRGFNLAGFDLTKGYHKFSGLPKVPGILRYVLRVDDFAPPWFSIRWVVAIFYPRKKKAKSRRPGLCCFWLMLVISDKPKQNRVFTLFCLDPSHDSNLIDGTGSYLIIIIR